MDKLNDSAHLLLLAYRRGEFEKDGVLADIVEISDPKTSADLYLASGTYTIVRKDENYSIAVGCGLGKSSKLFLPFPSNL